MGMVLAAMSDSWRNLNGANTTPNSIIANGDYDAGGNFGCAYFDSHFGWDVFYGMLWDGFYGGQTFAGDLCKAQQILNSAFWDGPFDHDVYDKAYPGWCATRRFFDDSPRQNNGKLNFNGNFNGLDFMLLFNLYYLDSKQQAAPIYVPQSNNPFISDHFPYWDYSIQGPTGDISDPAQIFSPTFPVIVNQLSVTANSGPVSGIGDLTIYGNAQGVLLTNTTVENDAHLTIFNTEINSFCIPLQGYYFDPTYYHLRLANSETNSENDNSNQLPFYSISDEFKQHPKENSLSAYPSPANGSISVDYILIEDGSVSIYLQDMLGKNVLGILDKSVEQKGTFKATIETSKLPTGIYNCVMKCNGNVVLVKKIIITH